MLRPKLPAIFFALSSIVLLQMVAMRIFGMGIVTDWERLNDAVCLGAIYYFGWAALTRLWSSQRVVVKVLAIALLPVLLLFALVSLLWLTMPTRKVLGKFETGTGSIVFYFISLPLTSDCVSIENQYRIFPGVHAFKNAEVVDTAWAPSVERKADQIVLTWNDERGSHERTFWPH